MQRQLRFKRPTGSAVKQAIGDLASIPEEERKWVTKYLWPPNRVSCFQRIPHPGPGDWLACFAEPGQTFDDFGRADTCARPHSMYRTIYVRPIGHSFNSPRVSPLDVIQRYIRLFFFGLECEMLPVLPVEEGSALEEGKRPLVSTARPGEDGKFQLWTKSVLDWLEEDRKECGRDSGLARRGQAAAGLKNEAENEGEEEEEDCKTVAAELVTVGIVYPFALYPFPSWNFVFGVARVPKGIGVYSFARFDPLFPRHHRSASEETREEEEQEADAPPEEDVDPTTKHLILRRSLSTLTHELGHLFGLDHCIYFSCLMQGSNHQQESDRGPLFLCPVCLRKLWESLGFGFGERYFAMWRFFQEVGLREEAEWIWRRFEEVGEEEKLRAVLAGGAEEICGAGEE